MKRGPVYGGVSRPRMFAICTAKQTFFNYIIAVRTAWETANKCSKYILIAAAVLPPLPPLQAASLRVPFVDQNACGCISISICMTPPWGGLTSWLRTALRPAFCTLRGKCLDNIEMIPVIAVMFRTCGCVCCVWALCVRNVRTNLELVGATAIQRRTSPLDECSLLMSWHTGQLCA